MRCPIPLAVRHRCYSFLAVNASLAHGEQTKPLLVNGSFEEGQNDPLGWNRNARGDWGRGMAHRGQRFARVDAGDERGWESNAVPLSPKVDYRLEGWIRAAAGEAHLGVDLLDASGQLVRSIEAPHAEGVADWRYVAVEFKADAAQAKVRFAGQGPPISTTSRWCRWPFPTWAIAMHSPTPKAGSDCGAKKKMRPLSPGKRAGTHRSDPARQAPRGGQPDGRKHRRLVCHFFGQLRRAGVHRQNRAFRLGSRRTQALRRKSWPVGWTTCRRSCASMPVRRRAAPTGSGSSSRPMRRRSAPLRSAWWPWRAAGAFGSTSSICCTCARRSRYSACSSTRWDTSSPGRRVPSWPATFFPPTGRRSACNWSMPTVTPVLAKQVPCAGRIYSGEPDDWGWYFWRVDFSEWQKPGKYRVVSRGNEVQRRVVSVCRRARCDFESNRRRRRRFFLRATLRIRRARLAQGLSPRRCETARRHAPGRDGRMAQRRRLQQADVAIWRQRRQLCAGDGL